MRNELWLQKIKEQLKDYSEQLPESGWEQLEKELHTPTISSQKKQERKILPIFYKYAIAAAIALLVFLSSTSIWLFHSPIEKGSQEQASSLAAIPDKLPQTLEPITESQAPTNTLYAYAESINKKQPTVQQTSDIYQENSINGKEQNTEETTSSQSEQDTHSATPNQNASKDMTHSRPYARTTYPDQSSDRIKKKKASKGWSMGLSIGNTGGSNQPQGRAGYSSAPNATSLNYSGINIFAATNDYTSVYESHELVLKRGIPYLMERSRQISSISHKLPVSAGISIRKELPKGFSIETGLTYTYLASDITFENNARTLSQKLHYLGIPLRANWNFLDRKDFTLYVSAGGTIEKCVYGKIGDEKKTVTPLQYSVSAAVGAQYNISRRVGIYAEPGIAYFFDDGAEIETIRKENPCNFTLQAGIRLTY